MLGSSSQQQLFVTPRVIAPTSPCHRVPLSVYLKASIPSSDNPVQYHPSLSSANFMLPSARFVNTSLIGTELYAENLLAYFRITRPKTMTKLFVLSSNLPHPFSTATLGLIVDAEAPPWHIQRSYSIRVSHSRDRETGPLPKIPGASPTKRHALRWAAVPGIVAIAFSCIQNSTWWTKYYCAVEKILDLPPPQKWTSKTLDWHA